MLEAITCVTTSQMIPTVPTAEADAPIFDHGEIADIPKPAPSAIIINDNAITTNAPPITADQDTPGEKTSRWRAEGNSSELSIESPSWFNHLKAQRNG